MLIIPKFLSPGPYLTTANLFLGMILMAVLNCLLTGIKSRDRNYLDLSLFFTGAFINAVSNLYSHFFIPTVEPYIGSWLSLFAFTLFSYNYLNIKNRQALKTGRNIVASLCIFFIILSIIHPFAAGSINKLIISIMDISASGVILILLVPLIILRTGGNKKAGTLIFFEALMILGAISAMGIFKDAVAEAGIPTPLLDGNFLFLTGMVFNGLLFPFILGSEMTELKVNHALAEREKLKLQQMDIAKNDFMMNISHELRTPVTIINGIIHQLRTGRWGNSIEAADNQFEIIERNNLRLIKQINGLLELSQLEQHKFTLKPAEMNLEAKLAIFTAELQSAAEQKEITIASETDEGLKLCADPHLFDTAILNLISNAIKFTQPGGMIRLRASRHHNQINIDVSDNGPGIPYEQQDRIFNRFQQVETAESSLWRGAGIGLSLVKGIMELHEGKIKLTSSPGQGSTFSLIFPYTEAENIQKEKIRHDSMLSAYRADLQTAIAEDNPQITEPAALNRDRHSLLLVEDNKDLLNYLKNELSDTFTITTASNGQLALEILKSFKPSIIISDVMMPEMDGRQLYREIRKNIEYKKIPFLFLTARNSADEKIEALNDGAVDYIGKPFSIEELKAKASAIIESVKLSTENYKKNLKNSVIEFIDNYSSEHSRQPGNEFKKVCSEKELTTRECEIAALLRKGLSDKEIAAELNLSVKTISNYNTSVFRKLEVTGRSELIALNR